MERLLDNFQEFEANKLTATWHPPGLFYADYFGYRRSWEPDWFDRRLAVNWDFNTVIDYIDYLGAPPNFRTPDQTDRRDVSDYARLGFEFDIKSSIAIPFTLEPKTNRFGVSYAHKYRRPFDGSDTDAGLNTYKISVDNFLDSIASISIEYEEGIDPDSLADRDNWSLKAQFKAAIEP